MLSVVSTLLDLSAIQAGQCDLAPEPLDLAELVDEGCRSMRSAAERAGVALAQDVAPDLPELHADRRVCRQILLSLLSEGVSAAPRGGLIRVEARREGDRLVLAVSSGGAPAADRPRLAGALPYASSGRGWAAKGGGLGLAVARDLVALHGGRIDHSGAPGEGHCTTVSLPIEAGRQTRAAPLARFHLQRRFSDGALAIRMGQTGRFSDGALAIRTG